MPQQVMERQRGQRPEASPRTDRGEVINPSNEVQSDPYNKNGVTVTMEEAETLLNEAEKRSRIAEDQEGTQRHGIVEQRRGVTRVNDAGVAIGHTEMWRCQCGQKFQGRTVDETRELTLAHLRRHDPEVPR